MILGTIGIVGIYLRFAAVLISLAACSAKAAVEAVGGRVFGPGMFGSEAESPVSMPLAESYAEER